jgi:hypothetical protein
MMTDQENQDLVDFIFSQQKNKMASLGLGTISGFTWQVQVQHDLCSRSLFGIALIMRESFYLASQTLSPVATNLKT